MATQTPWGPSQTSRQVAPGIIDYTTAGHGGIHVSPSLNAEIPECLRQSDGWYEEDCEWAIVAYVFPQYFPPEHVKMALDTLKNWRPDAYERLEGVTLQPGESYQKDKRLFREAHKGDYLVLSAWGDWDSDTPKGYVRVFAGRGGRLENGHYPPDTAYFLVPAEEYRDQDTGRFVLDERRHRRVEVQDALAS